MNSDIDIHNLALVVIGSFNPAIIHPMWLVNKGLIRESDSNPEKIQIVHRDISKFELNFATIQVTHDRFEIFASNEADFMPMRDLALSIFSILRETPINSIGFNHLFHKSTSNSKEYEKFGNWLSPLNNWKDVMRNPKLLEIKIVEPSNLDGPRLTSTIMPSDLIRHNAFRYQLNYHINVDKTQYAAHDIIPKEWEASFEKAKEIFNHLIQKYNDA